MFGTLQIISKLLKTCITDSYWLEFATSMMNFGRKKKLEVPQLCLGLARWYSWIILRLLRYKIWSSFTKRRLQNMHYGFLLVGICNQYDEFWKKKRCRGPPPVSWLSTVVLLDYFKTSLMQNLSFYHPKMVLHLNHYICR